MTDITLNQAVKIVNLIDSRIKEVIADFEEEVQRFDYLELPLKYDHVNAIHLEDDVSDYAFERWFKKLHFTPDFREVEMFVEDVNEFCGIFIKARNKVEDYRSLYNLLA